ncbi:MAG: TonB-dependent receptor, partial [Ignavibacterium sp.]
TISMDDNGLSGTNFLLNGNYTTSNYKLFASNKPETKRTKNAGNYSLGIKNTSGETFIIDLNLKDYFTSLTEDNFSENLINANGFARLQLSDIGIGLKTNYQSQILNTDSLSSVSNNYLFLRPTVSFELFGSVKTEVGYSFNNQNGETFNDIFAAFGLRLSDYIVLMGEYAPQAEFVTSGRFLRKNDYFNPLGFDKIMVRKANYIGAVAKYEYERFYQIDVGFKHYKAGNLPYFIDSNVSGQFDIETADAKEFNGFVNVLFHTGPYGVFYFNLDYYNITNGDGKRLPYYPKFTGNFTYGYELSRGLLGEILFDYYSDRYTDIDNTNKLSSFFNLGVKLTYKIQDSFLIYLEATNLLNRDIFYWKDYKEKPFDLFFGINLLFD